MHILFTGLLYRREEEAHLLEICRGKVSAAQQKLQANILEGLKAAGADVTAAVCVPAASYPRQCSQLTFESKAIREDYYEIGYCNLPWLKHKDRCRGLRRRVKAWLQGKDPRECVILLYDAYVPFLQEIVKLKKQHPGLRCAIVIPDLIGRDSIDSANHSPLLRAVMQRRGESFDRLILNTDKFILLTKQMAEKIGCPAGSWTVMEGMVADHREECLPAGNQRRTLLYAGELNTNVDMDVLLQAFASVKDPDLRLWICGNGAMAGEITAAAEKDSRITYYGQVSQERLRQLERQVDVYVNPRQNHHSYTKYSFPSKNLEYLKTGKPVVAYKLDGIPEEYDPWFLYPENDSAEALANSLISAAAMTEAELRARGEAQQEFVYSQKSASAQCRRILAFL